MFLHSFKQYLIKHQISSCITLMVFFSCSTPNKETSPNNQGLTENDVQEIHETRRNFEQAWLKNDTIGILETLTIDAVLLPHHGDRPVVGIHDIKEFWFPIDSNPTRVIHFTSTIDEVKGDSDIAYIYGKFELSFEYKATRYTNQGNYLNILVNEAGRWKLSRLIWNDPIANVQPTDE